MKSILCVLMGLAMTAQAHEFHLQPPVLAGGNVRNVVVAGYATDGSTVTGVATWSLYHACSGRGCRPPPPTPYSYLCTWDMGGNLLSQTTGTMDAPPVLAVNGSETVYAQAGNVTTGRDSGGFGFVDLPSSHYSWTTPSGSNGAIPYAPAVITVTLVSDGDIDLSIADAQVSAQAYGFFNSTAGSASARSCASTVPVGSTCDIAVEYDPTSISCTASPYGYAYTGFDLLLVTDGPPQPDFIERFTVTGIPLCDDNDDQ